MAGQGLIAGRPAGAFVRRVSRPRGSGAAWLVAPPLLFLGLFLALPLVVIFTTALRDKGLGGSIDVVTQPLFVSALTRTFVLALIVTVICWLVGMAYALALVLARGWLKIALFGTLFLTFWISLLVRTYGWIVLLQPRGLLYDVLHALGLVGGPIEILQTVWAMYPGMVHIMLPYMVLPIYGSLAALDARQIAAAQSMGAGPRLILRKIVLPQIRPGAIAGTVLVFVLSLGFYVTPAFLGGPDQLTLGTIVQREFGETFDFGAASAMGAALLIIVVAICLLADRFLGVSRQWGRHVGDA
jgi:putative spermidine/putrescine transport system permease protein